MSMHKGRARSFNSHETAGWRTPVLALAATIGAVGIGAVAYAESGGGELPYSIEGNTSTTLYITDSAPSAPLTIGFMCTKAVVESDCNISLIDPSSGAAIGGLDYDGASYGNGGSTVDVFTPGQNGVAATLPSEIEIQLNNGSASGNEANTWVVSSNLPLSEQQP